MRESPAGRVIHPPSVLTSPPLVERDGKDKRLKGFPGRYASILLKNRPV